MPTPAAASNTYKQQIATIAGIYNVVTYGATGDGSTDDSVAIQAALDACNTDGGGTVYFPEGTYLISDATDDGSGVGSLKFYSNQHIRGDGFGSIVKIAGTADGAVYTGMSKMSVFLSSSSSVTDVIFSDLQIDGNKGDLSTGANEMEGIDISGSVTGPTYNDRITVRDCYIHDIRNDAVDLDYARYVTVRNNRIIDCGYNAIHAGQQESNITMDGNYIENCGHQRKLDAIDDLWAGLDNTATNAIVTNNIIISCPRGIRASSGGSNCVIANNVISQTDANEYAIFAQAGYLQICNNAIFDNSGDSNGINITANTSGGAVSNNTIRGTENGITINCSGPFNVSGNTLTASAYNYSISLAGGRHTCIGNTSQGKPSNALRGAYHVLAGADGSIVSGNYVTGTTAGRSILSAAHDVVITNNICEGASSGGTEIEIAATADDNMVNHNRVTAASTQAVLITAGANRTMVTRNNFNGSTATVTDSGTASVVANNIA